MLVFLFVTISLFNLIMAIFVDNVMQSTKHRRQSDRENNTVYLELMLRKVVTEFVVDFASLGENWVRIEEEKTSEKLMRGLKRLLGMDARRRELHNSWLRS